MRLTMEQRLTFQLVVFTLAITLHLTVSELGMTFQAPTHEFWCRTNYMSNTELGRTLLHVDDKIWGSQQHTTPRFSREQQNVSSAPRRRPAPGQT